jgi:hypothetical protein
MGMAEAWEAYCLTLEETHMTFWLGLFMAFGFCLYKPKKPKWLPLLAYLISFHKTSDPKTDHELPDKDRLIFRSLPLLLTPSN